MSDLYTYEIKNNMVELIFYTDYMKNQADRFKVNEDEILGIAEKIKEKRNGRTGNKTNRK